MASQEKRRIDLQKDVERVRHAEGLEERTQADLTIIAQVLLYEAVCKRVHKSYLHDGLSMLSRLGDGAVSVLGGSVRSVEDLLTWYTYIGIFHDLARRFGFIEAELPHDTEYGAKPGLSVIPYTDVKLSRKQLETIMQETEKALVAAVSGLQPQLIKNRSISATNAAKFAIEFVYPRSMSRLNRNLRYEPPPQPLAGAIPIPTPKMKRTVGDCFDNLYETFRRLTIALEGLKALTVHDLYILFIRGATPPVKDGQDILFTAEQRKALQDSVAHAEILSSHYQPQRTQLEPIPQIGQLYRQYVDEREALNFSTTITEDVTPTTPSEAFEALLLESPKALQSLPDLGNNRQTLI